MAVNILFSSLAEWLFLITSQNFPPAADFQGLEINLRNVWDAQNF
jgi:hypothetical protein